jgi:hypothetical protein
MEGNLTTNLLSRFVNKINGAVDIVSEDGTNFEHCTKTKRSVYEKSFRQISQFFMPSSARKLTVSGNMSFRCAHLPGHKSIFLCVIISVIQLLCFWASIVLFFI